MTFRYFPSDAPARPLTPREREVLPYVAAGRANKVIALDLGISMRTVETHRARIFRKTGVRNAAELARWLYGGGHAPLRLAEPQADPQPGPDGAPAAGQAARP
ncbi:helix-turn-helix transcriptional regulator [Orrella sp. JC864]|uniref:response regulator transcription factor n=1 Tax=Orrella sp. JC864 TaxID=3120298 RepID=UPI0012BB8CD9